MSSFIPPRNQILQFYIGTARVPGRDEPQDAIISYYSSTNDRLVNIAADVLIQRKMVEHGYVHIRWSKRTFRVRREWTTWLENTAIYAEDTHPAVRDRLMDTIEMRVQHFSKKWRELGLWTVEGKHSCVVCRDSEVLKEETTIFFSPWLIRQTQSDDWNGMFSENPPIILCPAHLSVSLNYSPLYYNFSPDRINALKAQLDVILGHVSNASLDSSDTARSRDGETVE